MRICGLLLVVLLFAVEGFAQTNELDNSYTPSGSSVLGAGSNAAGSSSDVIKNAIKFSPLMLTRGLLALQYERGFAGVPISLNASLGYTLGRDYMGLLTSDFLAEISSSDGNTEINYYDILEDGIYVPKKNLFFGFGIKTFPNEFYRDDANSYFEFSFRRYNGVYKVTEMSENDYYYGSGSASTYQNTTVRSTALNFIYGVSSNTSGKICTTHDFYMGIGLRINSSDNFELVNLKDAFDSTIGYQYVKTFERSTYFNPAFLCGYTFGIGW